MGSWVYAPRSRKKPTMSESVKRQVQAEADKVVEALKATHVEPPPEEPRFNYISDIYTKWHGGSLYFCATYTVPGPDALVPAFEHRFARLGYLGSGRFHLAFMRHNGKWVEIYSGLTLEEAMSSVRDDPFFHP